MRPREHDRRPGCPRVGHVVTSDCTCPSRGESPHSIDCLVTEPRPKRRLRACVEAWPEAETMGYDPRCCRFPKSCSATIYDDHFVTDADLEPPS